MQYVLLCVVCIYEHALQIFESKAVINDFESIHRSANVGQLTYSQLNKRYSVLPDNPDEFYAAADMSGSSSAGDGWISTLLRALAKRVTMLLQNVEPVTFLEAVVDALI